MTKCLNDLTLAILAEPLCNAGTVNCCAMRWKRKGFRFTHSSGGTSITKTGANIPSLILPLNKSRRNLPNHAIGNRVLLVSHVYQMPSWLKEKAPCGGYTIYRRITDDKNR